MKITELERAVLNHIARNSYQPTNYGVPHCFDDTSAIWTDCLLDSSADEKVKASSLPGIVASLSKKALVECYKGTDSRQDPSTITLTQAGFDAWAQAYGVEMYATCYACQAQITLAQASLSKARASFALPLCKDCVTAELTAASND